MPNKKEEIKKTQKKDITNNELKDSISLQNQQLKNSVNSFKRLMILLIILMIISVISQGLYFYAHKDRFVENPNQNTNNDSVANQKTNTDDQKETKEEEEEKIDYSKYIGTYSANGYRLTIKELTEETIDFSLTSSSTSLKIASIATVDQVVENIKIKENTITFTFTDDNFSNRGEGVITLEEEDIIKVNTIITKNNKDATWNIAIDNTELRKEDE